MSNPAYGYGSSAYSAYSPLHSDRLSAASSDPFAGEASYYRSRYSYLPPMASVDAPPRRSFDAVYHHPYAGQIEAPVYTQDYMIKRPRVENILSLYPQRPGEKDCAHYMMTRTCKYGETCKFDHPVWVPEGGLPDWKETPHVPVPAEESLPERPGEPDCAFYMKTAACKFGANCRFNHPKGVISKSSSEVDKSDKVALPERPSEPLCSFFAKTGLCKFGGNCKFNHPKDLHKTPNGENNTALVTDTADATPPLAKPSSAYTPALLFNSKGLPIRLEQEDCPFYMKTGSCKYGASCRYNHPDRSAINPPLAAPIAGQAFPPSAIVSLPLVAANILQNFDLHSVSNPAHISGPPPSAYPQRPGELECDYYMKTGLCKFGERCKFDHPLDRAAVGCDGKTQSVKLTLAGLPRREGAAVCAFYMKTATCKFGATCKFDHPPPGELVATASKHGTSATEDVNAQNEEQQEEEEDDNDNEEAEQ